MCICICVRMNRLGKSVQKLVQEAVPLHFLISKFTSPVKTPPKLFDSFTNEGRVTLYEETACGHFSSRGNLVSEAPMKDIGGKFFKKKSFSQVDFSHSFEWAIPPHIYSHVTVTQRVRWTPSTYLADPIPFSPHVTLDEWHISTEQPVISNNFNPRSFSTDNFVLFPPPKKNPCIRQNNEKGKSVWILSFGVGFDH